MSHIPQNRSHIFFVRKLAIKNFSKMFLIFNINKQKLKLCKEVERFNSLPFGKMSSSILEWIRYSVGKDLGWVFVFSLSICGVLVHFLG